MSPFRATVATYNHLPAKMIIFSDNHPTCRNHKPLISHRSALFLVFRKEI